MAIEYLGLSEINGPLVVLEGVKNASYEEIVEFHMDDGTRKIGRIIEIYEDKAVIQVFEGTDSMSLSNTHTRLTGHPMEIGLSPEILGRTFNGIGQPIDGLGDITPEVRLNINGLPLNPVAREYPRNYINTGPVSHLETVLADTPNFSASCSCVRFFSLRHCFKKAPIFFVSMSLPLFHLQLTNMYQNYHDIKRESANFQPDIVCLKQINGIFTPKAFYSSIN